MYDEKDAGSRTFDDLSPGCLFEELALRYDCLFARSFQNRYLRHFERVGSDTIVLASEHINYHHVTHDSGV
jgi:hypothetical protein